MGGVVDLAGLQGSVGMVWRVTARAQHQHHGGLRPLELGPGVKVGVMANGHLSSTPQHPQHRRIRVEVSQPGLLAGITHAICSYRPTRLPLPTVRRSTNVSLVKRSPVDNAPSEQPACRLASCACTLFPVDSPLIPTISLCIRPSSPAEYTSKYSIQTIHTCGHTSSRLSCIQKFSK